MVEGTPPVVARPSQFIVGPNAQMKFVVNCFVNNGCYLPGSHLVMYGDNCMIGPEVYVLDDEWHETAPGSRRFAPIAAGATCGFLVAWLSFPALKSGTTPLSLAAPQ